MGGPDFAASTRSAALVADCDPMSEAVARARDGFAAYDRAADGARTEESCAVLAKATYLPPLYRLIQAPPVPTTDAGVAAAIRFVLEDIRDGGHTERLAVALLGSVLVHLEGRHPPVAASGSGAESAAAEGLQRLIEAHRVAMAVWLEACERADVLPAERGEDHEELEAAQRRAAGALDAAMLALLSRRPRDLDELRTVLAYLSQAEDAWATGAVEKWEWTALLGAILGEGG